MSHALLARSNRSRGATGARARASAVSEPAPAKSTFITDHLPSAGDVTSVARVTSHDDISTKTSNDITSVSSSMVRSAQGHGRAVNVNGWSFLPKHLPLATTRIHGNVINRQSFEATRYASRFDSNKGPGKFSGNTGHFFGSLNHSQRACRCRCKAFLDQPRSFYRFISIKLKALQWPKMCK